MAGEITYDSELTSVLAGLKSDGRLTKSAEITAIAHHQFAAATELEAADTKIMNICLPTSAIITEIALYNDDLDTDHVQL